MTATRVHPLPVRLDVTEDSFQVFVGDRSVASAWGPAADDPDTWFHWNGHTDPYRICGGRDGAYGLIEDRLVQWQRREGSLWHPNHGPLNDAGRVAVAPFGVVCIGCGDLIEGTFIATETHATDVDETVHYVCDNCDAFNEDD